MPRLIITCPRCGGRASRLGESDLARCNTCNKTFQITVDNTKVVPDPPKRKPPVKKPRRS